MSILRVSALACLTMVFIANEASANVVYALDGVKFTGGPNPVVSAGELTGTFTLSSDLSTLIAANLTASAATNIGGFNFAQTTYTLANSALIENLPGVYFRLTQANGSQLELRFATPLTATGVTQITVASSYESQRAAGNRRVSQGSVIGGVPEPSTIVMAAIGLPLILAGSRKIRRIRPAA